VSKLSSLILILLFVNNCSFNENQNIWKNKDIKSENKENIKELFIKDKIDTVEFNSQLKLDLTKIIYSNHKVENKNNYGSFNYQGFLKEVGNYRFSKFNNINKLDFKPVFLNEGIIFFDKKGSIIRYNQEQKIIWKKNYYSKKEKKLHPKLNFAVSERTLLVTDNIAKYYAININNGELIWSKNNIYPFNSEIKFFKDKFFVIDYKNTLRCYDIASGLECWNLQTEGSFILSDNKHSLIILNKSVIFSNSIGDITAVDIDTGIILWQLPTQSNNIINEIYSFKNSKLISDGKSIFFSNNKNEFYSIDSKNGTLNWINEISSNLTPVIIGDFIFTVSNDGYLFVIQKEKGNIIRINDVYKEYNIKKRADVSPIGFVIGLSKIYITNNDGKLIVGELNLENTLSIKKISNSLISQPFIFNENLFIIRNGSIIQYN
tara:strand:- start:138 stop:1436 length:1299 start_codon:yes stop_codon:yes gene_type:complete